MTDNTWILDGKPHEGTPTIHELNAAREVEHGGRKVKSNAEGFGDVDAEQLHAAAVTLQMAIADPLEVATQNASLRSAVRNAYNLIHILVRRAGGDVTIKKGEYAGIPPIEKLAIKVDDKSSDVRLTVDTPGHRRRR